MITTKHQKFNSYNYLGAIHIHSVFSDGTGDINSITYAAKKAGLDWIIITDHNNFNIEEGYFNGVCVIKGEEISPRNANHYLALGINNYIAPTTPSMFVEEVRTQGGFGIAAHPDESDYRRNSHLPIKWLNKNIIPDGVEIWNWFSQWGDNLNEKNIFKLIYSFLFKYNLVTKPSAKTLKWWDKLNNNSDKIVPAIGGIDAHALKIKDYIIPVTIFPYETMFKTIINVLTLKEPLDDDFKTRKNQILNAIKNGNNVIVNKTVNKLLPEIKITNEDSECFSGESVKLDEFTCLSVKTDKKSLIKILRNGEELVSKLGKRCHLVIKEIGKYRVEIDINNKGFAYTNPILVY